MTSETEVMTGRSGVAARVGRSVPAGMVGGAVFGLGIRGAMRVAALMEGLDLELTVPGTFFLVVGGAVLGAVLGPVAVLAGGAWRRRPVLGAALVSGPVALGLVVLGSGSEIADIGQPVVNVITFGSSGAALGAVAAWRAGQPSNRAERARSAGAIVIGSVAATALVAAVSTPVVGWVLDRLDGGSRVHPALPNLRDPRVESLGEALGAAAGALLSGALVGVVVAGVVIAARRMRVATARPGLVIGAVMLVLGGLGLLLPEGPRTLGNTAVIAVAMAASALAAAWLLLRISRWFDPALWHTPAGAPRSGAGVEGAQRGTDCGVGARPR